jgi:hypothetical protein
MLLLDAIFAAAAADADDTAVTAAATPPLHLQMWQFAAPIHEAVLKY